MDDDVVGLFPKPMYANINFAIPMKHSYETSKNKGMSKHVAHTVE